MFYFDVDGEHPVHDTQGVELASAQDARHRALMLAVTFVQELDVLGEGGVIAIRVKDEYQAIVSNVRLVCEVDQGQPDVRIPTPGNDP
ncbi:DUF6894 family protein [Methylobacterium haplocladii]